MSTMNRCGFVMILWAIVLLLIAHHRPDSVVAIEAIKIALILLLMGSVWAICNWRT